jgi:hypothetical protein
MSRIKIGNYLLKPAVDVAYVRDSHRIIEGKFVEGEPRRPAREGDGYNEDDNYGKLFRLHDEQIDEFLSNPIQSYWDQFSD